MASGKEHKTTPKAAKSPTMQDIAWAAGIFEGEGYVKCDPRWPGLKVVVVQKDSWLCYKLQEMFGGTVTVYKRKYKGAYQSYFNWGVNSLRAAGFMQTIFTYLSPRRRKQAKIALTNAGWGDVKYVT